MQALLHRYGLGALFAGNVLGAGSVYILSQTGATVGFALLWVLPLAFALDMVMHDMSSRAAVRGKPLMEFIRETIGIRAASVYAVVMALVMSLWGVANYAVAGAVLAWFSGGTVQLGVTACALMAAVLVMTGTYGKVEAAVSGLIVLVFFAYASLTLGIDVPMAQVGSGLVPGGVSDATLVIAMLGTTVYYPNFFIQSSMRPTKEWVDVDKYRRDNAVGIGFSVLVSAGILTVAATTLGTGDVTLMSPVSVLGDWALPVFMLAVLCASFTSATGTLFGSGFAVPQAFGIRTQFNDKHFVDTVVVLVVVSALGALAALQYTDLTPVKMAILMPAVNGALFLPLTILAMFVQSRKWLPTWQQAVTVLAVLVMFAGSAFTARSLIDTVITWL